MRLPKDACWRTTPEDRLAPSEVWTGEMQLLALLIEVVSIKVAGKGLKKPIDIPRPGKGKNGSKRQGTDQPDTVRQTPEGGLRRPVPPPSQQGRPDPVRDQAFKAGIAVLRNTTKSRG